MDKKNRAVFLDRDGVINDDDRMNMISSSGKVVKGHTHKRAQWFYLKGAIEGLKKLSDSDYKVIIITNQSAIARGFCTEKEIETLHDIITEELNEENIYIDKFYICPHHPTEGIGRYKIECDCRKPKIGLIRRAILEYDIDPSKSFMVGDKKRDVQCGKDAGCKTIFIDNSKRNCDTRPDFITDNLDKAADIILKKEKG